jgi:hypothetical protein
MSAYSGPQHRGARRLRKVKKAEEAEARNEAYQARLLMETPEAGLLTDIFGVGLFSDAAKVSTGDTSEVVEPKPAKKKRQRSRSHRRAG